MFHSKRQEAQEATGCGKDKQHYERNSTMAEINKLAKDMGIKLPPQARKVKFKGVF